MDKNAIKKYAVWARRELISRVSQKAVQYGITEENIADKKADSVNGILLSKTEKEQRAALINRIEAIGLKQTMEEAAYTWFNRFSALRYMEVNGYLPTHIRVFTDEQNAFKPQILTEAIHLELDGLNMDKVYELKDANKTDELYKYLLITQCNALSKILPGMFTRIADYTELLFPDNLLREGSVIEQMISMIPEDDWKDAVQIIGWLYQYYNAEPKDKVFANLKKNIKISKENIPAATQLFTPDWIVRYMVENSLGRIAVSNELLAVSYSSESERIKKEQEIADKMGWKYYLPEAEQTPEARNQLTANSQQLTAEQISSLKVIDPCMGSGHILVYAFDVLMQIYENCGYTQRDAVQSIITNNLFGVDIDYRAYQLAYFSIMMKGREYDRRFFARQIIPHLAYSTPVYYSPKANILGDEFASFLDNCAFADEAGLGSLRSDDYYKSETIHKTLKECDAFQYDIFDRTEIIRMCETASTALKLTDILSQKYDVVITNPPYMGASGMSPVLSKYVKDYYPDSKSDLFAVFIERCTQMTKNNGYTAMITQHSWMFLSSFEKLREKLLQTITTVNMAHLGARAFDEIGGEVVQTTAFVFQKSTIKDYKGTYCRLLEPTTETGKKEKFLSGENRYTANAGNFSKIPGSPVAYWVSENFIKAFERGIVLSDITNIPKGLSTGSVDRFMRFWYEVIYEKIDYNSQSCEESKTRMLKWFPYAKGGAFRRWYGNLEHVVNWENNGYEVKNFVDENGKQRSRPQNTQYYFKKCMTYSAITSYKFSLRYLDKCIFGGGGDSIHVKDDELFSVVFGLMNTKLAQYYLSVISPTLNFEVDHIKRVPLINNQEIDNYITSIVENNISISKSDWDSFETSWDFKKHPLITHSISAVYDKDSKINDKHWLIENDYKYWKDACENRFKQLKSNEEELNRIFIDIYGLQDELTPEVEDKDVTVNYIADTKEDAPESMRNSNYLLTKQDVIKSLISYAVGCMLGRYSLDTDGLAYAGGEWDASKYITFEADKDNIIPICDDDYFDDDITGRFIKWVETVYGKDTLEDNLKFIADALDGKGTPRDVIRSYFLNDFYADHCKIYQKRPIYWLFDSGKKNGFKALIYMHRYAPDTIARMRTDYVHEQQSRYRTAIADLQQRVNGASTGERVKLTKQLDKMMAQADEIRAYEEKIHHLADMMIPIDLDDGVKVNYAKFADVLAKIK